MFEGGGRAQPRPAAHARRGRLRFYTINNARLHFEEREKGSIEAGKLADLILVDRDPLTCPEDDLRTTRVLATMVGGRLVYQCLEKWRSRVRRVFDDAPFLFPSSSRVHVRGMVRHRRLDAPDFPAACLTYRWARTFRRVA